MTRVRWVTLGVAVFVLALGAIFVATIGGGDSQRHGSLLNRRAPRIDVRDLDGRPVTLDTTTPSTGPAVTNGTLEGKVVLVNFWNSWCIPCKQEAPALAEFYAKHRNDPDFAMVGIVRDDDMRAVREYVARENVKWTIANDPNGRAAIAFGTNGQPETYVIDSDGVVRAELWGPAGVDDLDQMLRAAREAA
jgi:cytochrome c biogenesis protein CcmG, thiol:disulfide interchange protein DsbE